MSRMSIQRRGAIVFALTGAALALSNHRALAQGATYHACYVPSSGTVYRIKESGLKQQCGTSNTSGNTEQHVEFSWSSGLQAAAAGAGGGDAGGKQIDHGSLIGLSDDDHSQYLLANGDRSATHGFSVSGQYYFGSIPATGKGIRLMWYPARAAFRVGYADETVWEAGNIGDYSIAMGYSTRASGPGSFATGWASDASGQKSTAMGWGSVASGGASTAIGAAAVASGEGSLALGVNTVAGGQLSTAMGANASTNGKRGAFVYGDASPGSVQAAADNQFVVRAQRFWLGSNTSVTATTGRFIETSTGGYLSSGGAWVSSSDVARKTRFEDVNGRTVLEKLAAMPIRTWSYKAEGQVRHMGPTAQDFYAAFGLGDTDKAIAGVDADGVSLAAIQALMQVVKQQDARIRELEAALHARTR